MAETTIAHSSVTKEEFDAFHNIDRTLFTRLLFNLGREPGESMQVMALLLWLEHTGMARNLVYDILQWPDIIVNALVNEAVQCLKCIESQEFPLCLESIEVPMIQSMTKGRVSLRYFYDHRLSIIGGIDKNINEVCVRAFEDIMAQLKQCKAEQGINPPSPMGFYYGPVIPPGAHGIVNYGPALLEAFHQEPESSGMAGGDTGHLHFDTYDLEIQKWVMEGEIGSALSSLQIGSTPGGEEKKEAGVPADERTIFLTFSKGYPISETEVRDFFTGNFGDCIEAIHMQEVEAEEQPLYARLVVQPPSSFEKILGGRSQARFSINGKHARGRKYLPKKNRSPPQSPPPSSSRPAASTAS